MTEAVVSRIADFRRPCRFLAGVALKKITIVDNGQEERLRKYCLGKPGVDYISLPNPGFGAAHNRALLSSDQRIFNVDIRCFIKSVDYPFGCVVIGIPP